MLDKFEQVLSNPVQSIYSWFTSTQETRTTEEESENKSGSESKDNGLGNKENTEVEKEDDHTQPPIQPPVVQDESQSLKSQGNDLFKQGKYQEAVDIYTEAIECYQKDFAACFQNRAAAYEKMDRFEEVVCDCTSALKLQPKYCKALFRRANAHQSLGDLEECYFDTFLLSHLDQGVVYPDFKESLVKTLNKYAAVSALKHSREIGYPSKYQMKLYFSNQYVNDVFMIDIAPGRPDKTYSRIIKHIKTSNYAAALDLCSKEIDQEGKHKLRALLLRGTLCYLMSDFTAAKEDLNKILLLKPDPSTAAISFAAAITHMEILLVDFFNHLGKIQTASFLLGSALKLVKNHPNLDLYQGRANVLTGDLDEACKFFRTSISMNPSYLEPRLRLFHCLKLIHKEMPCRALSESAGQLMEESVALFPLSSEMLCEYALFTTLGMYCPEEHATNQSCPLGDNAVTGDAIDLTERAMTLDPDSPKPHIAKGFIFLGLRDYDAAETSFKKSLDIDATATAYVELGKIAKHKEDYEGALKMYENALRVPLNDCYALKWIYIHLVCSKAKLRLKGFNVEV